MKTNCDTRPGKQNASRRLKSVEMRRRVTLLSLVAFVFLAISAVRAVTIYAVADNGKTNLFGALDVSTGHFTTIAQTTPLFFSITSGPGDRLYGADVNSGHLFVIETSGATVQLGSVTAPSVFYGLAYPRSNGRFLASNLDTMSVTLDSIARNGKKSSLVGQLVGPDAGFIPTGNLAFGPDGQLYFNYSSDKINAANSQLYTVNTFTGELTAVGSGLGSQILALFSDGTALYGVDTFTNSNAGIYMLNTASGVATRVSTVTGLPRRGGYYVDAATALFHRRVHHHVSAE